MECLVTVATFSFPADVEARKLLLEQEGIRAFLADANLVGMDWLYSNAVGGVKLQVAASDAARARMILNKHGASGSPPEEPREEHVTFACQECGQSITFPCGRCGHVENCPHCGSYVDVPEETESAQPPAAAAGAPQPGAPQAEPSSSSASDSRTDVQIWIEVLAVLCLAQLPSVFTSLAFSGPVSSSWSFVHWGVSTVVDAVEVSVPLMVIVALAKDPWSRLGIVCPWWIIDLLLACLIWVGDIAAFRFAVALLPRFIWEMTPPLRAAHPFPPPSGMPEYFLLLVGCLAGAFKEELVMRGYLIPRLERLLRSTWLPVLVTSVLFGSLHLYQGLAYVVVHTGEAVVYAVSFCCLRRLWPLCVAHGVHNFIISLY